MRPENEVADSEFAAFLDVAELDPPQVHRIRVEELKVQKINLDRYSAIIAGGSPFDVSCPDHEKSDTQKGVESFFDQLFDRVMDIDFPFLGACSGNGLLGRYCGTSISGKYSEPVGSVTVTMTGDGENDELLSGLPCQFLALVGHKEACDYLPSGAKLLLTSGPCPVQMFRIKKNIYATQFHPEADAEQFVLRINTYKEHGYFKPEIAEDLISAIVNIETPVTKEILRRFVAKYHYHQPIAPS